MSKKHKEKNQIICDIYFKKTFSLFKETNIDFSLQFTDFFYLNYFF